MGRATAWSRRGSELFRRVFRTPGGPGGRCPAQPVPKTVKTATGSWLSPEQLARLTGDEIAADLKAQGMEVSGRYARQILDEWRAAARQASAVRKPRRT